MQGDPSGPRVTVCPGATTTFIRTGTDENGDVKSRDEYTVTVFPLGDLTISPEAPVFCADPVTLTAAEGFEHYVWLDEMGNELGVGATYEATAPGVYTVEAEDAASGCLARVSVEVTGAFSVEVEPEGGLACDENSLVKLETEAGYAQYTWRVIDGGHIVEQQNPPHHTVTVQGYGRYEVTVANSEGCTAIAEIELKPSGADEIRAYFESKGFFAYPIEILGPIQAAQPKALTGCDQGLCAGSEGYCVEDKAELRFSIEAETIDDPRALAASTLEEFGQAYGYSDAKAIITANDAICLCDDFLQQINDKFENAELGYWIHLWEAEASAGDPGGQDLVFIKANLPGVDAHYPAGPQDDEFIRTGTDDFLTYPPLGYPSQPTFFPVMLDKFLPNYTEKNVIDIKQITADKANTDICENAENDEELYSLAPSGIPIQLPERNVLRFSRQSGLEGIADRRCLSGFSHFLSDAEARYYSGRYHITRLDFLGYYPLGERVSPEDPDLGRYSAENVPTAFPLGVLLGEKTQKDLPGCQVFYELTPYTFDPFAGLPINATGAGEMKSSFDLTGTLTEIPLEGEGSGPRLIPLCQRDITFAEFEAAGVSAIVNPYGNKGILYPIRKPDLKTEWIYARSETLDPFDITYYRWDCALGMWKETEPPEEPQGIDFIQALVSLISEEGALHSSLDALGFVPVIGSVADFINGTWYLFEGNYGDASLAFIGAIPLIGDGIKALPGGAKLLSKGKEVISLGALGSTIRTKMFGRVRKICLGAPPQTITGLAVTVFFDCPFFELDASRKILGGRLKLPATQAGMSAEQLTRFKLLMLKNIEEPAAILKWINETGRSSDELEKFYSLWKQADELGFTDEALEAFAKDIVSDGGRLVGEMAQDRRAVEAWQYFFKGNMDEAIRKDPQWLEKLSEDLAHDVHGPELRAFFEESPSDVKDIWQQLKLDPSYHWEIYDDGAGFVSGSRWSKWSAREFFKAVTQKGKEFEIFVTSEAKLGKNPPVIWDNTDFVHHGQLHIQQVGSSNRIVGDDIYVKDDIDEFGLPIKRAIFHDTKLSSTSSWTPNQRSELIDVFRNDPNKRYIEYEVRTQNINLPPNSPVTQGQILRIYREDVYKTVSNGNGSIESTINVF